MNSTSAWPYFTLTRRQDATFWQSSSAQISLIAHQIKCFLRFRLCTCCCQLHPCDRRGHGHVCCGLMAVSLLCADHWALTLLIRVTVQHVAEKTLRKLSRLTVTCAWLRLLHWHLVMRRYCLHQSTRDIIQPPLCGSDQSNHQHFWIMTISSQVDSRLSMTQTDNVLGKL